MVEPILIVLAVGAAGGIVRSILGYKQQSDEGEAFNYIKLTKSMIRAALVGAGLVVGIAAATGTEITMATYISAFFLAVGADVLAKEGSATIVSK